MTFLERQRYYPHYMPKGVYTFVHGPERVNGFEERIGLFRKRLAEYVATGDSNNSVQSLQTV